MGKTELLRSKPSQETLGIRQKYSLAGKITVAEQRIREWYEEYKGNVYVAFSGGKDSTVLLHLVRTLYPEVPGVFVDTGLEYPEIRKFVKTFDNIVWLKPKMPFTKVIEHYGFPIVSKEQAQYIDQYRNAKSEKTKHTRWYGNKWNQGKVSEKWKYLIDAPFKISEKCCDIMKKKPNYIYEKETGKKPYIGTMAGESSKRKQEYLMYGCNAFNNKRPTSKPLSIWLDEDIWNYIKLHKIAYAEPYDMGYTRTGCVFCAFGCHLDKEDRFLRLQQTHPKLYEYCMDKLGLREVLKWYLKKDY